MLQVLVIEDNDVLREQLCEGLENACYRVYDAQNGSVGLERFKQIRPAVVVTDIVMDDGEGIEAILAIREIDQVVKIIAISGNPDYLENSGKLGADRLLLKPFALKELIKAIENTKTG